LKVNVVTDTIVVNNHVQHVVQLAAVQVERRAVAEHVIADRVIVIA
jgi:hypothetical protein